MIVLSEYILKGRFMLLTHLLFKRDRILQPIHNNLIILNQIKQHLGITPDILPLLPTEPKRSNPHINSLLKTTPQPKHLLLLISRKLNRKIMKIFFHVP
jgi:hypothetical protein